MSTTTDVASASATRRAFDEFWHYFSESRGAVAGMVFMIFIILTQRPIDALFRGPSLRRTARLKPTLNSCANHLPGRTVAACNSCWEPMRLDVISCRA